MLQAEGTEAHLPDHAPRAEHRVLVTARDVRATAAEHIAAETGRYISHASRLTNQGQARRRGHSRVTGPPASSAKVGLGQHIHLLYCSLQEHGRGD